MNIYKIAVELAADDTTGLIADQSWYDLDAGDVHDMEMDLSKKSGLQVKFKSTIINGQATVTLQIGNNITKREGKVNETTKFIEDLFDEAMKKYH
jgi:hypothetical protein